MRAYLVKITGTQPLIMHNDDVEWADAMEEWRLDKENAKNSKPGDDRYPAFRWIGCLYHDTAGHIIMPTANIMRSIMGAAAEVPVPGARNSKKTFKAQSQSGMLAPDTGWPLVINGSKEPLPFAPIEKLMKVPKFTDHKKKVGEMGFELFVKRGNIGGRKHVRVRPRFQKWSCSGVLKVSDDQITKAVLESFLETAGTYKGLGDWRPSSPKSPGPYGVFTATVANA